MLDAMTGAAAFLRNDRLDLLASNHLGRAVYAQLFDRPLGRRPNTARFCFLDPRAHDFYVDWERSASSIVAILRSAAGRNPYDRELTLNFESMARGADPGLTIVTYTADSGSENEEALKLLDSWAATPSPEQATHTAGELPSRS
jgi:hypothetical protein